MAYVATLQKTWVSGSASLVPTWTDEAASTTTTLVTEFDAGNVDPDLSSITNPDSTTPEIYIDRRLECDSDWKHLLFALEGVDGKTPTFQLNRATMQDPTFAPSAGWLPLWTQDFITWNQASSRTLTGDSTGTIDFSFDSAFPSGRVYISTHPLQQNSYAGTFAAELLADYNTVASVTASGDASGVYNTSPSETNASGRQVGLNDQYAVKLAWGGATTDGGPKRKLVMTAGTHAAGEQFSWVAFESSVRWILDSASVEAQNLRANWDIYLYFNVTPNGVEGGHRRWNLRSSTDPNRDFVDQTLQEVAALTSAISADTGGAIDAYFAWHTWSRYDDLYIVATRDGLNTETQAFVTNLESAVGNVIKEYYTSTGTGAGWSYDAMGATVAFEAEMGMRAPTAIAGVQDVGVTWMETLEATDSQGHFVNSGTLAAQETGTDTLSASGTVSVSGALAAQESGADTASASGSVLVSGALDSQETGSDDFTATGSVGDTISGTLAVQESGSDTASISGTVEVSGALAAQEEGQDSASATGLVLIQGGLSAQESGTDSFTASGTVGSQQVSGTLTAQESGQDQFAGLALVAVNGQLVAQESGNDVFSATELNTAPSKTRQQITASIGGNKITGSYRTHQRITGQVGTG